MITIYSIGLNNFFYLEYTTSVVYSRINRSYESKKLERKRGLFMTQRQRKYWREMTKFSNYKAILLAVGGPNFKLKDVKLEEECGNDIVARTKRLEEEVHLMYVSLKSLGAINTAQKLAKGESISKEQLDVFISEAKDEINTSIKSDENLSEVIDDDIESN